MASTPPPVSAIPPKPGPEDTISEESAAAQPEPQHPFVALRDFSAYVPLLSSGRQLLHFFSAQEIEHRVGKWLHETGAPVRPKD
jgi:hypothetical protein